MSMNEPPAGSVIRVLVVEGHELMADLLALGLSRAGMDVRVAPGGRVEDVLLSAHRFRPAVVLVHVADSQDCLSMIEPLTRTGTRVLLLSADSREDALVAGGLDQGAAGSFDETQAFGELVDQIKNAAMGRTVIDPTERAALCQRLREHRAANRAHQTPFSTLSLRERQVLAQIMDGRAAGEIAREVCVSVATVRTHIRSILHKLDVNSQLAAVVLAQKAGWRPDRS